MSRFQHSATQPASQGRARKLWLLAALGLALLPRPVSAETSFSPKAALKLERNDNIFFDEQHTDGRRGDRITTLRASCDIDSRIPEQGSEFKASLLADAIRYRRLSELNTLDNQAQASLKQSFENGLKFKALYNHKDITKNDRAEDLSLGTSGHAINETVLSVESLVRPDLSWISAYSYRREAFENESLADYNINRLSTGLTRQLNPRLKLNLSAAGALYDYDQWIVANGALSAYSVDQVRNLSCNLSADYALDDCFSLKLAAGRRQTATRYNHPAFSNLNNRRAASSVGQFDLRYSGSLFNGCVQYSKDIKKTGSGAGTAQKDAIRLDLGYAFLPALEASLAYECQLLRASRADLPSDHLHRSETVHKASPRLRYKLAPGLALDFEYCYNYLKDHDDRLRRQRHTSSLVLSWVGSFKLPRPGGAVAPPEQVKA